MEMKNETGNGAEGGKGLAALLLVPALSVMLLPGCGDVFEATNPGRILPEDLNNRDAIKNLVTGMSSDYSAIRDNIAFTTARASDEMAGSGSYTNTNLYAQGIIQSEDVNFEWNATHRAHFNAVNGLEIAREVLEDDFQGNPLVARAHLFAALTNMQFGENFCRVAYDGGPAEPRSGAFQRAIEWADQGIPHAQQAGEEGFEMAMIGIKAQANVGLGDWSAAAQFASQVPTDFEHVAIYSDNSGRERSVWWAETHNRFETSAFNTFIEEAWENGDPRVELTDCRTSDDCSAAVGADGVTPHLRQEKFPDPGSDIPVVTGEEMRYIEAEAALRDGDPATAVDQMNMVRAQYDGLDPLPASLADDYTGATDFDANDPVWATLDRERGITLWLEAKRLWDLHRWDHPFLDGGEIAHGSVPRRASGIPIARDEVLTNENISDAPGC